MEKKFKVTIGVIIVTFSIVSCSTMPMPYSFANEGAETAQLNVVKGNPGLSLIYVDGNEIPNPLPKTHWEPLEFPAGQPIKLTVHAYYQQENNNTSILASLITTAITASRSVNRDVLFECPSLTAGKNYKLTFRKGSGLKGDNLLVLTDVASGKIIHQQEFESK